MTSKQRQESVTSMIAAGAGFVLFWMPVWIPLGLLAQVSLRGLQPSLTERERLLREERSVTERFEAARRTLESMQAEATAWKDPVYLERVRRAREAQALDESR